MSHEDASVIHALLNGFIAVGALGILAGIGFLIFTGLYWLAVKEIGGPNVSEDNQFYGWYDDPDQPREQPSYEPPRDAPCPYCGKPITPEDVRTHSLIYAGPVYAKRSYFYRTHGTCDDSSQSGMDGFVLDMIARNGD